MNLLLRTQTLELSSETVEALKAKYPTKDVGRELSAMHLWLLRYSARRPVNGWRFVDNWLKKSPNVIRPPIVVNGWWASDERTINQGAALGMQARPGETMAQFRDRISNKLRAA